MNRLLCIVGGFDSIHHVGDDVYLYIDVGIVEYLLLYYNLMSDDAGVPELQQSCEQKLRALHHIATTTSSSPPGWSPLTDYEPKGSSLVK